MNDKKRISRKLAFLTEDKLKASERTDFGLPDQKKYPMPDKSHVLAAIRMFNHVDKANEQQLAANIKSKMKIYGISSDQVGEKNRLKQYLSESKTIKTTIKDKVSKEWDRQFTADNIGKETSSAIVGVAGGAVAGVPGIVVGSLLGRVGYEGGKAAVHKMKKFI